MADVADSTLSGAAGGAATGASVGSVVPGYGTAIGAGVGAIVGGVGGYISGQNAADAAGSMSQAQLAAAQQYGQGAVGAAAPTALQLANMNQQLQAAGTSLQRQAAMFASVDPAIMEASKQALQLMQGQSAATIAPMLQQRQVQRTQLMQQLQQQLGPGAAASSAGSQALADFDMQTSTYQSQLQQSALGTLLQQTDVGAQSAATSGQLAQNLFGQVGQQSQAISQLGVQANLGAGQLVVPNAGAGSAGALASATNAASAFGQLGKGLGAVGGAIGAAYGTPGTAQPEGTTSATSGYGLGGTATAGGYGSNTGSASPLMGLPQNMYA